MERTGIMKNDTRKEQALLLELVRQLASELHGELDVQKIDINSSLEREAGIDSLARIELLLRIEQSFGKTLPEEIAVGAQSVADLARAIEITPQTDPTRHVTVSGRKIVEGERSSSGIPNEAATLVDVLQWHVETDPEKVHIHLYNPGCETTTPISYRRLFEEAKLVSAGLRSRGVLPGDRVGIMLPTSPEYLQTFFGILIAGAVPVPIYPPGRIDRIEEHLRRQMGILENAKAKLLVSLPEAIRLAPLIKTGLSRMKEILTYDRLVDGMKPAEPVPVTGSDIAFIQYTSGSTGNPKGVVLSHANLLANVTSMGDAVNVVPTDVIVSWLPLYHDMGLIGSWFGSLYYGIPLVLMSPLSFIARPSRWLRAIHEFGGTISAAPNFAYEICASRISDAEVARVDLSTWRRALNGAEPVHPDTLERFIHRFAPLGFRREAMAPVFGLAENSVGLLFPPPARGPIIDRIAREPFQKERVAIPAGEEDPNALQFVSCGSPIKGNEIRIVDENGDVPGDRRVGLLQFRGPCATSHYFDNPEATAGLFSGEWLNTGDYAYTADGDVFIAGRQKELIIRGGRNIYPYELEEAVGDIEGIRKGNVAVFGSVDRESGAERLVVLAETRERKPEKRDAIKKQITEKSLQLFQIPPDDIVLAGLRTVLKTSSGKIRRAECRTLYESGRLGETSSVVQQLYHVALSAIPVLFYRIRSRLSELAYSGYCWFLIGLIAPPVWLSVVLCPVKKLRYAVLRSAARSFIFLSGTRFTIDGMTHFPDHRPLVIVSNHTSYLDSIFLIAAFKDPLRFVAKAELKDQFFTRLFLDRIGVSYVQRFDAAGGIGDIRDMESDQGAQTSPIVFFAEGTFTELPGLRPFRMGAFVVAVHTGASVLPVALRGTREKLRDVDSFIRRGDVELTISPPITTAETGWNAAVALRDRVRSVIAEHCGEKDLIPG